MGVISQYFSINYYREIVRNNIPDFLRKFVLRGLLLYVGWHVIFFFVNMQPFHVVLSNIMGKGAEILLQLIGFDAYVLLNENNLKALLYVGNQMTVSVAGPCDGFALFLAFGWLLLAFPSPQWQSKIWFLPLGIIVISLLNMMRVGGLSLVAMYLPEYVDLNHKYIFKILVYLAIFLLWAWWIKNYSINYYMKQK